MTTRRVGLVGLLLPLLIQPAAGQSWLPAFGVQGGFTRIKPAGTNANDQVDVMGLPGTMFLGDGDPAGALFAVVPVGGRFAIEPSLSFAQTALDVITLTTARLDARLDVAFGPHLYGAVGGEVSYLSGSGGGGSQHVAPLGITVAIGLRAPLSRRLEGRIEAEYTGQRGAKAFAATSINEPPLDMYSLHVGVSSSVRDRAEAAGPADGLWTAAVGVQGGYYSAHFAGAGTLNGLYLPGLGTSTGLTSAVFLLFPQSPSMITVIPVRGPWAVEAGFALGRFQIAGPGNLTFGSLTLATRVNYAVTRGWYAAAGVVTNSYKTTNRAAAAQAGLSLAWGYRFHIAGDLGGRAEGAYTMFAHNHVLGVPPVNLFGIDLGVMMGI